jgi:hypothetical protein
MTWIGTAGVVLAILAMGVDHLMGDDPGLDDPPAFLISVGIVLVLAGVLFGWTLPRTIESGDAGGRIGTHALAYGLAAVVVGLPLLWLGVPFVLGGAAVALGLVGRAGQRRRRATVGLALGALVAALGTVAYAAVAVDKLS